MSGTTLKRSRSNFGSTRLRISSSPLTRSHSGSGISTRKRKNTLSAGRRELPNDQPIKIVIHLPEREAQTKAASELGDAFARYFSYRGDFLQHELNELFRVGRRSLAIGITILVACLLLSHLAGTYLAEEPFRPLVQQSLPILGWVANWRPLEIFLYDWWPLARRRDLYRRLSAATLDLEAY